jgi:hypothetical protein
MPNDVLTLSLDRLVLFEDPGLGWRQDAIKPAQDSERQDDLAVLVALVRTAEEVTNAPDKVGELCMGFSGHRNVKLLGVHQIGLDA